MRVRIAGWLLIGWMGAAAAAEPAAETIRWNSPWSVGTTLVYETEQYDDEQQDGKPRETTRLTTKETIRISDTTADGGFVQDWTWSDSDYTLIAGDEAEFAFMRNLMESFSGLRLQVELDAESNFVRIRNLEQLRSLMDVKLRPMVVKGIEDHLQTTLDGMDLPPAERKQRMSGALKNVDAMMARMLAPDVVHALLAEDAQIYNDFVGIDLEPDAIYAVETEMQNPLGKQPFPALLEFGLSVGEDDPDDIYLEWTSTIDPVKGMVVVRDAMRTLFGTELPDDKSGEIPDSISIVDKGFILFRRESGVIEMLESRRDTAFGPLRKLERRRMRLIDTDHDHVWVDKAPSPAPVPKQ